MNSKYLDLATKFASEISPNVVRPNPRVGCVIVQSDEVVATGVHEKFGSHHAEVNAISSVPPGFDWSDAEVYITLEPCDHFEGKKTPSCTELLILKNPQKVIIGNLDPQFCGKNVEKLKRAGIEVEVVDHQPSLDLNPYFETFITQKRPYVCLKMAMSLDGKISQSSNSTYQKSTEFELESLKYISNEKSRQKVHQMRSQFSAILTTTETVMVDDPRLDIRQVGIQNFESLPDLLIFGSRPLPGALNIFKIPNRKIYYFDGKDLKSDFEKIASFGYDSIFTECGAKMATELLLQGLVDEIVLFVSPKIFGKGKSVFEKEIDLKEFRISSVEELDGDIVVRFGKT